MIVLRKATLIVLMLSIGCSEDARNASVATQKEETLSKTKSQVSDSSYIYVLMKSNDHPQLDYEGEGLLKESSVAFTATEREYDFHLVALHLPLDETFVVGGKNDDPKHQIVEFAGKISRSDKNCFSLKGRLVNKIPIVIQFCKILRANGDSNNEFPELSFDAGQHDVQFNGSILGWYDEDRR